MPIPLPAPLAFLDSLGGLWEKTFLGCEMAWIALLAGWCAHLARPDAASVPAPVSLGAG